MSEVEYQSNLEVAKRQSSGTWRVPASGAKVLMCVCEGAEGSTLRKRRSHSNCMQGRKRVSDDLAKVPS